MSRRVFLMNPPSGLYRRDDRCQSRVDDQTVRVVFPPIDLAVLAAVARDAGSEVFLRDYPAVRGSSADFHRDIRDFQPQILLLNATAHTLRDDLALLAPVRREFPDLCTIAKGESIAARAEKTLEDHPELDAVLFGEAEDTLLQFAEGILPLEDVAGLVCRTSDGTIHRTPERPMIEPLDRLPLPARDLLDNSIYLSPENGRPITAIHAQRGCPSKCIFCPAGSMYGYKVRERSVGNVMAEITECVERYGIRDFLFHGDTFTLHKDWVIDLCKAIIESGLRIHWGCNSRVDTIDDERAQWLKRAGCWVVAFGFEHGVQDMLDRIKKGVRVNRAFEAVKVCRRNKLKVHGFFVVGFPWETHETLKQTLKFAHSLETDFFDINIACPLPGTELFKIVEREGLFDGVDFSQASYAQSAVRSYALSSDFLTKWRKRALLRLYLRPGYIFRTLKHAAATGQARHYAKAAMQRLAGLMHSS